jgi:hypothetical protein
VTLGDRPDDDEQSDGDHHEGHQLEQHRTAEQRHTHATDRAAGEHEQHQVQARHLAAREEPGGDQPEQPGRHPAESGTVRGPAAGRRP